MMKRKAALFLVLLLGGLTACSNGCASAQGGLYVGVRSAKDVVRTVQHGEEKLVCDRPTAPPAPACVPLELHHTIHGYIAEAAEYGQQLSLIMADVPQGDPTPGQALDLALKIKVLVQKILDSLPKSQQADALAVEVRAAGKE
jgi:hypothetical protein